MSKSAEAKFRLGDLAVNLGLLRPDQVNDCLKIQRESSFPIHFGQLCINQGFLTVQQVKELLAEQEARINRELQKSTGIKMESVSIDEEPTAPTKQGGVKQDDIIRVLCIDDSATIRAFVKMALYKNVTVRLASNWPEAREVINGSPKFDLIILDIVMPVVDGFQIAENLKEISESKGVPVLFFSTHQDPGWKKKVKDVGGIGLTAKPDFDDLETFRKHVLTQIADIRGVPLATGPFNILVADDCRATRTCVQVILRKENWNLELAKDGREALGKHHSSGPFDVIILDLHMPHIEGYQLAKEIRKTPGGIKTKYIVLSGIHEKELPKPPPGVDIFAFIHKRDLRDPTILINVLKDARGAG